MEKKSEKLYNNLLDISKKIGLPVKKIVDLLFLLKDGKPIDNNKLIQKLGVSRNVLNQVKESLTPFLIAPSTNTQLKNGALDFIAPIFESEYHLEDSLLSFTLGSSSTKILSRRLEPLRKYDQFTATPETVVRRVNIMNFLGDIKGRKILFLGDDDFTSVLVGELHSAKQLTVIDIDTRVLNSIETIASENRYDIETFQYDARNPLPKSLSRKFDVVFTDPPYTSEGVRLFLSRAIEALDPSNLAARIYFCYGNSDRAKERFLPIYQNIVEYRLMLRYVFDKFNRYEGAESIGSSSSLFVTETTPQTKTLVKGKYEQPIYTNN